MVVDDATRNRTGDNARASLRRVCAARCAPNHRDHAMSMHARPGTDWMRRALRVDVVCGDRRVWPFVVVALQGHYRPASWRAQITFSRAFVVIVRSFACDVVCGDMRSRGGCPTSPMRAGREVAARVVVKPRISRPPPLGVTHFAPRRQPQAGALHNESKRLHVSYTPQTRRSDIGRSWKGQREYRPAIT